MLFWQFSTRVVHTLPTHACFAPQGLPQPPQFWASFDVSTQVLLQAVVGAWQLVLQTLLEHT